MKISSLELVVVCVATIQFELTTGSTTTAKITQEFTAGSAGKRDHIGQSTRHANESLQVDTLNTISQNIGIQVQESNKQSLNFNLFVQSMEILHEDFLNGLTMEPEELAQKKRAYDNDNILFDEKNNEDGYYTTTPESPDYPYPVLLAILLEPKEKGTSVCTGSLLTTRWTISAAHCFRDRKYSDVLVYVGRKSVKEEEDKSQAEGSQVQSAKFIYPHPHYSPDPENQFQFDLALVKVRDEFQLTKTVNTVPLPVKLWDHDNRHVKCKVVGFGSFDKSAPEYTRKAHFLEIDMKDGCACLDGKNVPHARKSLLCSKSKKDSGLCSGDSGGGLICNGELVAITVGFKTYKNLDDCTEERKPAEECGGKNTLNVFQQTYPFINWIKEYIHESQVDDYKDDYQYQNFDTTAQISQLLILTCSFVLCVTD